MGMYELAVQVDYSGSELYKFTVEADSPNEAKDIAKELAAGDFYGNSEHITHALDEMETTVLDIEEIDE